MVFELLIDYITHEWYLIDAILYAKPLEEPILLEMLVITTK